MKRIAILFVAIGLQVLFLGAAQAEEDLHGGDHKHQSVRITSLSVRPAVLQIHTDDAISSISRIRLDCGRRHERSIHDAREYPRRAEMPFSA